LKEAPVSDVLCTDKKGRQFHIRDLKKSQLPDLLEMYRSFRPKGRFQGMPPAEIKRCEAWISELFRSGENLLAWRGKIVIGHAVVLPDPEKGDAEYMIFVHQGSRNVGVGSGLTKVAIERIKALGIRKVWLTVGAYNFIAIRLYRKFGFDFSGDMGGAEKIMVLSL
jgi:GNAT superfamily N-acetyltransferase